MPDSPVTGSGDRESHTSENDFKTCAVDDLTQLPELSEHSLLASLNQRFTNDDFYTYISSIVVCTNPYEDHKLCTKEHRKAYSAKQTSKPHPYMLVNEAIQNLAPLNTRQAIVLSGHAGSKSEIVNIILKYVKHLSLVQGGSGNPDVENKLVKLNVVLDAFGNAKTASDKNASRFGKSIQVYFDSNLQLVGAEVAHFFPEISRVVQQATGEQNYHIFSQLCAANDKEKYHLSSAQSYVYLSSSEEEATLDIKPVLAAMDILEFSSNLQEKIRATMAAILHLGNLEFTTANGHVTIAQQSSETLQWVAELLELSVDELTFELLAGSVSEEQAVNNRDALAKYLFEMTFEVVVAQCNAALITPNIFRSLSIIDLPGFESITANRFDQLLFNYSHDYLQRITRARIFADAEEEHLVFDPCRTIERAIFPWVGPRPVSENIGLQPALAAEKVVFPNPQLFNVTHYAGEVSYALEGFCQRAHNKLPKKLEGLGRRVIQKMIQNLPVSFGSLVYQSSTLSRHLSKFKTSMEGLEDPTQLHYVYCLKPNHSQTPRLFDVELMRQQIVAYDLVNVVKSQQRGFTLGLGHKLFYDTYKLLSYNQQENDDMQKERKPLQRICIDFINRLSKDETKMCHSADLLPPQTHWFKVGFEKVWMKAPAVTWLRHQLDIYNLQELHRKRLAAAIQERNTDTMRKVIDQAKRYLASSDAQIEEAEALFAYLERIVRSLQAHSALLDGHSKLSYEARMLVETDIRRAKAAGLSKDVSAYSCLRDQLLEFLSYEDRLDYQLQNSNYESLKAASDFCRGQVDEGLIQRASQRLEVMSPILDALQQAIADGDVARAFEEIANADEKQFISIQLTEGRHWVRRELLRQLNACKVLQAPLTQVDSDRLTKLAALKDQISILQKLGDPPDELDAEIDQKFQDLQALRQRSRVLGQLIEIESKLAEAKPKQEVNAAKALQLSRQLADSDRQEVSTRHVKEVYDLCAKRDKQLEESVTELISAVESKNAKEIRRVWTENESLLLPKDLQATARKVLAIDRELRGLIAEKDVDKIDLAIQENPALLEANSELGHQLELSKLRATLDRIRAAQQSKNVDELLAAISEAEMAQIDTLSRVKVARKELESLYSVTDALESALEEKNFTTMRAAFVVAIDAGVQGTKFSRLKEVYLIRASENNCAREAILQVSKANLARMRRSCDLKGLISSLEDCIGLGFADEDVWQAVNPGLNEFRAYHEEFERCKQLTEQLTAIEQELSQHMKSGSVVQLREIMQLVPRTENNDMPMLPMVQNCIAYLKKVSQLDYSLQQAVSGNKIQNLTLYEYVLTESQKLKLNYQEVFLATQQNFADLKKVEKALNETYACWFNDFPTFLLILKEAKNLGLVSDLYHEAVATAKVEVSHRLELAFRLAMAAKVGDTHAESRLREAIKNASNILSSTQVEQAKDLVALMADAGTLSAVYHRRDVSAAQRWINSTAEKLSAFPFNIPDISKLVQHARKWHEEAQILISSLEGSIKMKQADVLCAAVRRGQQILAPTETGLAEVEPKVSSVGLFQHALKLNAELQAEVKRIEQLTAEADDDQILVQLLRQTNLHPETKAVCAIRDKRQELLQCASRLVEQFRNSEKLSELFLLWRQELNEARAIGDLEGLWDSLKKHDWQCDDRSQAVEFIEIKLGTKLQKWIAKASRALRGPEARLPQTMVKFRELINTAKRWMTQDDFLRSRNISVNLSVAENLSAALKFRQRIETAMNSKDENSLKLALIEYKNKFPDREIHDWLVQAQHTMEKIEIIRGKLNTAIASGNSEKLFIALADAKEGAGESWPRGSALSEDDPTLREAEKALQDLQQPPHDEFAGLREALASRAKWQKPTSAAESVETMTNFPLGDVAAKWLGVVPLLSETKIDQQVTWGAHAGMSAMLELYNMKNTKWMKVRNHVRVGLVKETADYGNTSVSMGLARLYFDKYPRKKFVGFMNCGTGGVKYQLYGKNDAGIIVTIGEHKPGQKGKADPATFAPALVGEYKPVIKKGTYKTIAEIRDAMVLETCAAPWKDAELAAKFFKEPPEIFAFVTGTLRNHYYTELDTYKNNPTKELLVDLQTIHTEVNKAFFVVDSYLAKPVSDLLDLNYPYEMKDSYLIPSWEEARMESVAVSTLYKQMNKVLPNTIWREELEPVASFGIGISSTQFAHCQDNKDPLTYKVGMQNQEVLFVGEDIANAYMSQPALLDSFIAAIEECIARNTCPTIALKSGCLLAVLKSYHPAHRPFLEALKLKPVAKTEEIIIRVACSDLPTEELSMTVHLPTTLPELCANATLLFRERSHKQHVQFIKAMDAQSKNFITTVSKDLVGQVIHFIGYTESQQYGSMAQKRTVYFEDLIEHIVLQFPEWSNTSAKARSISTPCIPLAWFPDKWHAVKDRLGKSKTINDGRKTLGTHAALSAFKDMCYMEHKTWEGTCLQSLQVGIVKSTYECGNSSVSMGLAVQYFADESLNADQSRVVGFLNFGTGGLKLQLYTNLPQRTSSTTCRIALVAELKPGELSFADLEVDDPAVQPRPKPDPRTSVDRAEFQKLLKEWLQRIPWNLASWPLKPPVPIFAFITGPLRDHWDSNLKDKVAKDALREFVNQIIISTQTDIRPVSAILCRDQSPCYFITGDDEGRMELIAVRTMYSQIYPGLKTVAVLGIGRPKSRFTLLTSEQQAVHVGNDLPGMDKAEDVLNLGALLVQGFRSLSADGRSFLDCFTSTVNKFVEARQQPLIAMKSGSLLLIEEEQALREFFVERPVGNEFTALSVKDGFKSVQIQTSLYPQHTFKLADKDSKRERVRLLAQTVDLHWHKPISFLNAVESKIDCQASHTLFTSLPTTSSRLCAMAAVAYGTPTTDFLRVFLEFLEPQSDMTKLVELKDLVSTKHFKGSINHCRLYFFDQHDLKRDTEMKFGKPAYEQGPRRDNLTQLIIRSQNILTYNDRLLEETIVQLSGLRIEEVRDHVHWMAVNPLEVAAVMQAIPFAAQFHNVGPPCGPPDSLDAYRAIQRSSYEKLPLGQYLCAAGSFCDAVAQQLQILQLATRGGTSNHTEHTVQQDLAQIRGQGRADLKEDENEWGLECKALTELYKTVTVNVFHAATLHQDAELVRIGSGSEQIWLFKDNKSWSCLWSPPNPSSKAPLLELLSPFLAYDGQDLQPLRIFAQFWRKISAAERTVFEEVQTSIRDSVDAYVKNVLTEAAAAESMAILDVYPMLHSPSQWDDFKENVRSILVLCDDAEFKDEVCEAFGLVLLDCWRSSSAWRWGPHLWYDPIWRFFTLLQENMTPDHFAGLYEDIQGVLHRLDMDIQQMREHELMRLPTPDVPEEDPEGYSVSFHMS